MRFFDRGYAIDAPTKHGARRDRARFFSRSAYRTIPMHELRAIMGHASITTTADYYTEASETVADAVRTAFVA